MQAMDHLAETTANFIAAMGSALPAFQSSPPKAWPVVLD